MGMKALPQEERPCERLWLCGAEELSLSELFAVVLRSGHRQASVMELAQSVLVHAEEAGGLATLRQMSAQELAQISGIGKAKAAQICAAIELGRRLQSLPYSDEQNFCEPESVWAYMSADLEGAEEEMVYALFLNVKNQLIYKKRLSIGGHSSAILSPREVVKQALRVNAASIILVHNHPSGNPSPSPADFASTRKVQEATQYMGLRVLDHIIMGAHCYYSFKREGRL